MTLDKLNNIKGQLEGQLHALLSQPPDKPVLMHCNAIELHGAIQLMNQLIAEEQIELSAPPGSTGPSL